MNEKKMMIAYDRKRTSTLTVDSQPGAHTGSTRKYIPGYSDANIIFRAPTTGNDANDGLTEGAPKLSQSSSETAAGTTKKIRIIENCTIADDITKPTEMKRGFTGALAGDPLDSLDNFTDNSAWGAATKYAVAWCDSLGKAVAVGDNGTARHSANLTVWTSISTMGNSSEDLRAVAWCRQLNKVAVGGDGKVYYSSDLSTWANADCGFVVRSIVWVDSESICVAVGEGGNVAYSADLETWTAVTANPVDSTYTILCIEYAPALGKYIITTDAGTSRPSKILYSSDLETWSDVSNTQITNTLDIVSVVWSPVLGMAIAAARNDEISKSSDLSTWTAVDSGVGSFSIESGFWFPDVNAICFVYNDTGLGKFIYSFDLTTWAASGSSSGTEMYAGVYCTTLARSVIVGTTNAFVSDAFSVNIGASIAGFSIGVATFSNAITAYNCSFDYIYALNALSLDSCRVEYDSHISNNAVTSTATLYRGDRHTTCTPASQNAIDMNLDTVGGTWYIYNASLTGYERIRDCMVEGGIVANYAVTVSGRANTRGTSTNVLFGADVTHDDPKFVNTTDYQLQFQTNGYARNSLAAGRSALYFNSAGDARDIGAWSYVESAISYYFSKSAEIYKGFITHELEEVVSEQQGDSGEISVYGNINRLKEAVTLNYPSSRTAERAVFEYMRFITDKTVKLQVDAEWDGNPITVVVNGNQSAGVEFLTVDATAVFDGEWLTISGKKYYIYRASPNKTAATKLILDRPLEDAVTDNDVIPANYPSGAGEYQYAAIGKLNLARKDMLAFEVEGWRTGFSVRFVRKASQ